MSDNPPECLNKWGNKLLEEFPAGLPEEPDFENDGQARLTWFSKGYSVGVEWASEIGLGGKVFLGGKIYQDPEALDDTDKAEFARQAFNLGRLYRELAQLERDEAAKQEAKQRNAIEAVEKEVEALRNEVAAINSREVLRTKITEVQRMSVLAREARNAIEDYAYSRKINTLQERLIEIEQKESRHSLSGWWWTVIGAVAGIIGLIIGLYAGRHGQG